MRLTLRELKKKISKMIPDDVDYEVDLEAGSIAIITKQPEAFGGGGDNLTVRIAKTITRRVVIRPHSDILADAKTVHEAVANDAWARTTEVVVPSPTASVVLEAASCTR